MRQTWHDLLFAHWPLPTEAMRPLVPAQLTLDTFDGQCWVGVVPFHMSGIRRRGLPAMPAVLAARAFYNLPYFHADMTTQDRGGVIHYVSRRYRAAAEFRGRYHPTSEVRLAAPGSIEHWLTERYCLYTTHRGQLYRGEIHHAQWPLQTAEAELETNTVAAARGVSLPDTTPHLLFARELDVLIWPLARAE
jgi:uncharacterized protein